MMKIGIILIILFLVVYIGVTFIASQKKAKERFATYEAKAKVVNTSFGNISYIDEGEGEVILCCHGICGGYDQAYDAVADKVDEYRVIAPSRFGYPGSDVPQDPSIENQVEAFVELLDSLKIEKTYVLATSAGGTTAIKFALMHPERTKGLILYCSGYPRTQAPEKEATYVGPPKMICNDFTMWFFSPLFGPLMGMEKSTIDVIMPLKERKEGIVIDSKVSNTVMYNDYESYDLRKIQVPIISFHAKDDKMASYEEVKPWRQLLPEARFICFEAGGHLMEGNGEIIEKELNQFIKETK